MLTCDEGRLCGRRLQQDHVLQKGVVRGPTVTLQRCCAQVGGEVGAREEGDALWEGREGESVGFLLAGCSLQRHER